MGTLSPGSVLRTKRMLSDALIRLVEKRSFRKISVGDICSEAQVSRSAFYSHFADKYELLSWCLEESLRLQAVKDRDQPLEVQILTLLKSVQEKRRVLNNIFMADLSPELIDVFQKTLHAAMLERLCELRRDGRVLPVDPDFMAAFFSGGLANVIICWIKENCVSPAEEIAKCQYMMISALGAAYTGKKG